MPAESPAQKKARELREQLAEAEAEAARESQEAIEDAAGDAAETAGEAIEDAADEAAELAERTGETVTSAVTDAVSNDPRLTEADIEAVAARTADKLAGVVTAAPAEAVAAPEQVAADVEEEEPTVTPPEHAEGSRSASAPRTDHWWYRSLGRRDQA